MVSQTGIYAIRAMVHIVSQQDNKPLLSRAIAEEMEIDGAKFEPQSMVIHYGPLDGNTGHYYAFFNNGTEWIEVNDNVVEKVSWDECQKQFRDKGYMISLKKT